MKFVWNEILKSNKIPSKIQKTYRMNDQIATPIYSYDENESILIINERIEVIMKGLIKVNYKMMIMVQFLQ